MEDEPKHLRNSIPPLTPKGEQLGASLRKPLSIESKRITLERKITLDFPHLQGFLTEYSSNISMTGMFVRSERPEAPGTVVAFEFGLADGLDLISGQAEVVWRREVNGGPGRPPGMGLRFVWLDNESRHLIRWAVEKQIREGRTSFELDDQPQGNAAAERQEESIETLVAQFDKASFDELDPARTDSEEAETRAKLHPYAGAAAAKSGSEAWRRRVYPAVAVLAVAALVAGALWWRETAGGDEPATDVSTAAVAPAVEAESTQSPAAPETRIAPEAQDAEPARAATGAAVADDWAPAVLDRVETWAQAWAAQRVEDYLACYAADFVPPRGMSRSDWSALRRTRIERPRRIEVRISEIETELVSEGRARVSFRQAYVSDNYRDTTRKALELTLENGEWKILSERAVR